MCHKKPLGKYSIAKGIKEISKRLDLNDWENFGSQALRTFMGTKLGNDASVSMSEAVAALRHKHVASQKHCNKPVVLAKQIDAKH